jgi:hypothetical protein
MAEGQLIRDNDDGVVRIHAFKGTIDQGIVDGGTSSFAAIDRKDDSSLGIQTRNLRAMINGLVFDIPDSTINLDTADATNPRVDMIQMNSSGTVSKKTGTPAETPDAPSPDSENIALCLILVPANATVLRSMNGQTTTTEAVIIAYYYANGGLHASRIGVTSDPSTNSTIFIDAPEMFLPLYFPRTGFRYEFAFDAMFKQTYYGSIGEGVLLGMNFDDSDEDDSIVTRGYIHSESVASIHGFRISQGIHYNRFVSAGSHRLKGRWKVGTSSVTEILDQKRRRIWVHEML